MQDPQLTDISPSKLQEYRERSRELTSLFLENRERQRVFSYHQPQGGAMKHKRDIEKANTRANQRLESVITGLLAQYCEHHKIEIEDFRAKLTEDPTAIEQFYEEALEIIPPHYRPDTKPTKSHFRWEGKRGPYVKPVKS